MTMNSSDSERLRILCLGDVVGRYGRDALRRGIPQLRQSLRYDMLIVNGENAAGGLGIDPATADELRASGVDVLTLGDHTWHKREMREYLDRKTDWCIRPANFTSGSPGRGWTVVEISLASGVAVKVGVLNLIGRVMSPLLLECPFRAADTILTEHMRDIPVRICDMHAEATSEKVCMGRYLDGRCSLVFGTHTHVQTADEQILAEGTGYITDLGMSGSTAGVIGMDAEVAKMRFLGGLPAAYKLAPDRDCMLCGVLVSVDCHTGRALSIERVRHLA